MTRRINRTDRRGAAMVEAVFGIGLLVVILFVAYEAYRIYTISINAVIAGRTVMKAAAYSQSFDETGRSVKTLTGDYMPHFKKAQFFLDAPTNIYSPSIWRMDEGDGVPRFLALLGDKMTGSHVLRVETTMEFKHSSAIFNTFGRQGSDGGQIPKDITFAYEGVCPINSFSLDNVNFLSLIGGWFETDEGRPSDGAREYMDTGD